VTRSVFIVAAERSGDSLGEGLVRELRKLDPDLEIHGIGGTAMAGAGVGSDYDISPLSILGFVEALKVYPTVVKKVHEAVNLITAKRSDAVVLIDSWGFTLRVAKGLRKAGYRGKIVKYVAPQVWAMRRGRTKILANAVDHLLTIHSFDAPYFESDGLSVTYVGNPVFDTDYRSGDADGFRLRHGIGNAPVISVWFGSRLSEIERIFDVLHAAALRTAGGMDGARLFSVVVQSVRERLMEKLPDSSPVNLLNEEDKLDLMAASHLAIACSGTVTTQLACAGVPTVVAYKLAPLTFQIARFLFRPEYISIVNIAADAPLMAEFVQHRATVGAISDAALAYRDITRQQINSARLIAQTAKMQGEGGKASIRAASAVLDIIGR